MADGLTSLGTLSWGTSTGGAAGSAESTLTLGVDRGDTRTPPDTNHVWGAQINQVKNLLLLMTATFKGGTRLGVLTQSSNPFGANESGFYIDASGGAWSVFNGTPTSLGGSAATGNWVFSGNQASITGGYTLTGGAASTVTTTSGGLTLTAAGTVNVQNTSGACVIGNTSGITSIRGGSTSSLDMSAGNGVTKTTTGTNTIGGAALFASTLDKAASGTWQIGNGNATTITYSSAQAEATGSAHIFDTANQYSAATNPVFHLKSAGHDLFKIFAGGTTTYMNAYNGSTGGALSNLIFTASAVQLGNAASVLAANADNGGFSGSSSVRWTGSYSYWYDVKLGAQLTAAATITPTSGLHHVTGATTITTIATTNVPASGNVYLTLVADGGTITLNTGGNIAANSTIAINTQRTFVWDATAAKWYGAN
jgi:hypothetical protein